MSLAEKLLSEFLEKDLWGYYASSVQKALDNVKYYSDFTSTGYKIAKSHVLDNAFLVGIPRTDMTR